MAVAAEYKNGVSSVLWAVRALDCAATSGTEVDAQEAAAELLRVATARESGGGGVQGFRAADRPVAAANLDVADSMQEILLELEVGQTLITAGTVAQEVSTAVEPGALAAAADQLDESQRALDAPADRASAGFRGGDEAPDPDPVVAFPGHLAAAVDGIVSRTVDVGKEVVVGLSAIPAASLAPIAAGAVTALSELPKVGPIIAAGIRAVRRAVTALYELLPAAARDKARELAKQWWGDHGSSVTAAAARGLLGAEAVVAAGAAALEGRVLDTEKLRTARGLLDQLAETHSETAATLERIARVLKAVFGIATALVILATWVYGAAALGFFFLLGAAVWIGRDYLDAGSLGDRVVGVRAILTEMAT
ncbi:MAG TPA: hypothetical protein VIT65_11465 [Microlunatus sp.]